MTPDEMEAGSLKWEPTGAVHMRQLRSGNFALYHVGGIGSPFWIGPPEALLEAYANRPPPTQRRRPPATPKRKPLGLDLTTVEFDL